MGDFNINLLNHDNASVNEFLSAIHLNSFVPLIDKPTRVIESSSSLIDNILTNNNGSNVLSGLFYNDITDHFPVFQITHFKFNAQCTPTRKFHRINGSTVRVFEEKVYNLMSERSYHRISVSSANYAMSYQNAFLSHCIIL